VGISGGCNSIYQQPLTWEKKKTGPGTIQELPPEEKGGAARLQHESKVHPGPETGLEASYGVHPGDRLSMA